MFYNSASVLCIQVGGAHQVGGANLYIDMTIPGVQYPH